MLLITSKISFSQSYDSLLGKAAQLLRSKEYCQATKFFESAFLDTAKTGTYDLAYAALAATQCGNHKQALNWLSRSQQKGFGLSPGEADAIATDSSFVSLHAYKEWKEITTAMKTAFAEKQQAEINSIRKWDSAVVAHQVKWARNNLFEKAPKGMALYHRETASIRVPYFVFVPAGYAATEPSKAVVFLHGGVVNIDKFNTSDPGLVNGEPIFALADSLNVIVIYPLATKDFGWVNQKAALENVLGILADVQKRYHLNNRKIILGGMSNGGTAAFWFAAQKTTPFSGFFALAAGTHLPAAPLDFASFAPQQHFYSIHAKDDEVYPVGDIIKAHQSANKKTNWTLQLINAGGHGFLYQPTLAIDILRNVVAILWGK